MVKGGYSSEDIQRVREANDLVEVFGERVPVKQRGRDYWCCCPFHNEKTPSLKIDPVQQFWHCFGCGEGGDIFTFVMKADELSFPEAVAKLVDRAHLDIVPLGGNQGTSFTSSYKARLKGVCEETAAFYHLQLMRSKASDAASARTYLASRSLGGKVPDTWNLGFAPGRGALVRHLSSKGFKPKEMVDANVAVEKDGRLNDRFYSRVMFPINDAQGECIAFGGRVIGKGEPKYLNSRETPLFRKSSTLYGLDRAKASMASTGVAIVVEGYTDVIALSTAGVTNVVATLGTALTMKHIRILSSHAKKRIVYLFDGDEAGQRAADRALGFIDQSMTPEEGKNRIELCAVTLPGNQDPAEFVASAGADALRALIDDAQPLLKYGIHRILSKHNLQYAEDRSRAMSEALSILAPIKDSLLAKDYAVQIASLVHAREEDALEYLAKLKPAPARDQDEAAVSSQHEFQSPASSSFNQSRPSYVQLESRMSLSEAEVNRRRIEREYLGLLAQNPTLALNNVGMLAQTKWSSALANGVAASLLETLEKDPQAGSGILFTNAVFANPEASGYLTSANGAGKASVEEVVQFLAEELSIGDLEDEIATLRASLDHDASMSPEERSFVFRSVVGMQKDLKARRLAHKPMPMA